MVSNPTKQNHLRCRGVTALRARVLAETELLRGIPGQQKGHQARQNHTKPSKKRPSSNPVQVSSRKRLKISQLEASPEPDNPSTFQEEIHPFPAVVTKSSKLAERTRHTMEQRWRAHRENDDDGGDSVELEEDDGDNDEDEEEEEGEEEEDGGEEDGEEEEDWEGEEEDGGEEDEDDPNLQVPGLSTLDLLGEEFECEAAALGLSSSCESLTQLMIL